MKKAIVILLTLVTSISLMGCQKERTFDLTEFEDLVSELVDEVSPSVVAVIAKKTDSTSMGSGIIYQVIGNKYFVLTNHHVIEGASTVEVKTAKALVNHEGHIYAYNAGVDIAVVTFESSMLLQYRVQEIPEITLGTKIDIARGRFVVAIGSPLSLDFFNTATFGMISNVTEMDIQHDAAINSGNSGGPLFNLQGQVIGINTRKYMKTVQEGEEFAVEGIGFAININYVGKMIKDFQDGDYINETARIGITFMAADDFRNEFGTENIPPLPYQGIVIVEVDPTRAAYNKLYINDFVLEINGIKVTNTTEVADAIGVIEYGNTYTFKLLRKNDDSNNTLIPGFEEIEVEVKV